MSTLLSLTFNRTKGIIRRAFSSWASGIITSIAIIFMLIWMVMWIISDEPVTSRMPFELLMSSYFLMTLFFSVPQFLVKRAALLDKNEAHYLLVGPYTTKQLIAYGLMKSMNSIISFTALSFCYLGMMILAISTARGLDWLYLIITTFLLYWTIFNFLDFLYIHYMTHPRRVLIRRMIVIVLGIITLLIIAYFYMTNIDESFDHVISEFMKSDMFSLIPAYGWSKYCLFAFHNGEFLQAILSLIGIIIVNLVIIRYTINTKELDVEVLMSDSEEASKMLDKSRSNNLYANLKTREVKHVSFKKGAYAISSRLLLELRKTNSFITTQEIILVLVYLGISIMDGFDFAFYSRYILIIIFTITMNANYNDELKRHYLYLIPDKPLKKLIALLIPTFLKLVIVVVVTLTCGIALKPSVSQFIMAIIEVLSWSLLFVVTNIWSLRILKKGSNEFTNNFLKMFIILIAMVPSLIIGNVFNLLSDMNLFSLVSTIVNLIVSGILIYASKGVVTGADLVDN